MCHLTRRRQSPRIYDVLQHDNNNNNIIIMWRVPRYIGMIYFIIIERAR